MSVKGGRLGLLASELSRYMLLDAGCSLIEHESPSARVPSVDIFHELADVVKGADVIAILTGHDEYFGLEAKVLKVLMRQKHPVVVDGRNVLYADGFIGAGLCIRGTGEGIGMDMICACQKIILLIMCNVI